MECIYDIVNNMIMAVIKDFNIGLDCSIHKSIHNDYQFNGVNNIANELNIDNTYIAREICKKINTVYSGIFEKIGIVNSIKQPIITIDLRNNYIEHKLNELYEFFILSSELPKPCNITIPKKIIVDFSSPNIAKEMHVGHLRSTIIGDSISRLFEYIGSQVLRINHVGDWGTQFGMIIAYIKNNNIMEYDIGQLMAIYKQSKILFDDDYIFCEQARKETVMLQNGDINNKKIWEKICGISMESFNDIYKKLDIKIITRGESFYQSFMVQLIEDINDHLTSYDGMRVLYSTCHINPFIIVKSDGGFTYDTSDLTALKYRIFEEQADHIIYVVDSGQSEHMSTLFQIGRDLGWINNVNLTHVGFGLVLGTDGKKLKTRSGESPKLKDLLIMAYEKSFIETSKLASEKHPDWNSQTIEQVSTKIAINCIKYADLYNPRLSNYKFNPEKMVSSKGNTAVYLMYTIARCRNILKKVPSINTIKMGNIKIVNNISRKLVFKILHYTVPIKDAIEQFSPHHLCNYIYDLSGLINEFYKKNRCIEFNKDNEIITINDNNIKIIILCEKILSLYFYLIGLEHVEQI